MAKKPVGFSKLKKDHAGHIDAREILVPSSDALLVNVVWHSVVLGAYFAISCNRAKSALKVYIKLAEEEVSVWCNTPEECVEKLAELNECLVEMCRDRGLIDKAPAA